MLHPTEYYVSRAREYFLKGYNCSQSVFAAFAEDYGLTEELALRLSASFGGGIARLREICGTCSALMLLEGLQSGQTQPDDSSAKQQNYTRAQELIHRFEAEHGSHICRELLQLRKNAPTPPAPDPRTAEYYKQRPCLMLVESAVRIWCSTSHN